MQGCLPSIFAFITALSQFPCKYHSIQHHLQRLRLHQPAFTPIHQGGGGSDAGAYIRMSAPLQRSQADIGWVETVAPGDLERHNPFFTAKVLDSFLWLFLVFTDTVVIVVIRNIYVYICDYICVCAAAWHKSSKNQTQHQLRVRHTNPKTEPQTSHIGRKYIAGVRADTQWCRLGTSVKRDLWIPSP